MSEHNIMQMHKSPYHVNNGWSCNEPVASDTIYAETPVIDSGGQTMHQLSFEYKSLVNDVYSMVNLREFVNTFEDVMRKGGAMDVLISDGAQVEDSRCVKDILCALQINDRKNEAKYQHQNQCERRWYHHKRNTQWWMNWRDCTPQAWLLCAK